MVDDGSPTRERALLQAARLSEVRILTLERRQGVTAAWNRGWRESRGSTLVFLNNDTVSNGVWLSRLIRPLNDPNVAMTGAAYRTGRFSTGPCRNVAAVRLLEGWCFAVRRELLESCHGFDRQLRLYFSDTDLQFRLRCRASDPDGCLVAVPGLPLQHLGHRSTARFAERRSQWLDDCSRFRRKWSRCGASPG